jgi:hypothetical protein
MPLQPSVHPRTLLLSLPTAFTAFIAAVTSASTTARSLVAFRTCSFPFAYSSSKASLGSIHTAKLSRCLGARCQVIKNFHLTCIWLHLVRRISYSLPELHWINYPMFRLYYYLVILLFAFVHCFALHRGMSRLRSSLLRSSYLADLI